MIKVLRFIGAVLLSIVTSIAIRHLTLLLFIGTIGMICHFSFLGLVLYVAIICIGGSILKWLESLILRGFVSTVQGSRFIAVVVIIIFINYLIGDFLYYHYDISWGYYSQHLLAMIKESAAPLLYKIGAGVTLLIELCCYGSISFFLFRITYKKEDEL